MVLRKEKGAISIFVLVALLFMSAFLLISYANNVGKSKTIKEQFNIISGIYGYTEGEEGAYDKAYSELRKKNKQILTASSDTSKIELTKTFDENMSNYRIYGNSVQDTTNGNPSPDNPVEIESVGDLVNLLDTSKFIKGGITGVGVDFDSTARVKTDFIQVDANESYTVTLNINFELEMSTIHFYDKNYNWISRTGTYDTFTTPENTSYIKIVLQKVDIGESFTDEEVLNLQNSESQLEKGINSTEYVPYGKYRIPIKIDGKNLLNPNAVKDVNVYITSNDGTEYKPETVGHNWRSSEYIQIKEGKTYHFNAKNSPANVAGIAWYNKNKKYMSGYNTKELEENKGNMTAPDGASYLRISWRIDEGYNPDWKNTLQLEEGKIETEYQEYKSEIFNIYLDSPLRKVGNISDYIDFKNKKLVRNVEVIDDTGILTLEESVSGLSKSIEEAIELPELTTYEDYTRIEVLTGIAPSKIEVEYQGYTLE